MGPPLPRAPFEQSQQTQHQITSSRVRDGAEMDLPIEEIGTVPIDQIDRESHVILPDGKQIVLLQVWVSARCGSRFITDRIKINTCISRFFLYLTNKNERKSEIFSSREI